jgi:hypothetical protein
MPTRITIVGEMTDVKLMQKVNEIMQAGYQVTFKTFVAADQAAAKLNGAAPVLQNVAPRTSPMPKRSGGTRHKVMSKHFKDFHSAEWHVLKLLKDKGEVTIDEICTHLANIGGPGKGYAMTTGATIVSKLHREGRIIRDEHRHVVLA